MIETDIEKVMMSVMEWEAFEETLEDGTTIYSVEVFLPDGFEEGDSGAYIIQYDVDTRPGVEYYVIEFAK